jgi:hypothetical protein
MFWSRGSSRQRRAVLSALAAVGETGMTLLALGLAVNLPEARLNAILDKLLRSGQVRRRGKNPSAILGPRTEHYQLASGRHSSLAGPQPQRAADTQAGPTSGSLPTRSTLHLPQSTVIRSSRAQGI